MLNEAKFFKKISENELTKGERTKLSIIRACVKVLHHHGLTKFTFENIAQQCGLKKSHIAYHFPNKPQLFDLTVRYVFLQGQEIVIQAMQDLTDPADMLQTYIFASHDWILKNPEYGSTITAMLALASQSSANTTSNFGIDMINLGYQRIQALLVNVIGEDMPEKTTSFVQDWLNGRVIFCAANPPRVEKRNEYKHNTWQVIKKIANIPETYH